MESKARRVWKGRSGAVIVLDLCLCAPVPSGRKLHLNWLKQNSLRIPKIRSLDPTAGTNVYMGYNGWVTSTRNGRTIHNFYFCSSSFTEAMMVHVLR